MVGNGSRRGWRRATGVAVTLAVLMVATALAPVAAQTPRVSVGGGASFSSWGFGLHAAVWLRPVFIPNLSARVGGEYEQPWNAGWRYVGADVSGLYEVTLGSLLPTGAQVSPYVGAGVEMGQWSSGSSSYGTGYLYGTVGAAYELGPNVWAWAELRLRAFKWGDQGETGIYPVGGVGFSF